MSSKVEIADRMSRKRPVIIAAAAIVFLIIQAIVPPFFSDIAGTDQARLPRLMWAVNVIVLLLGLATGSGILNNSEVRALINDEVSRMHSRLAVATGFWLAMATALAFYLVPALRVRTAAEAVYVILTASVSMALLVFAWLEYRSQRDG
jgi:hypothetical protein